MNLVAILKRPEGKTLEFKRELMQILHWWRTQVLAVQIHRQRRERNFPDAWIQAARLGGTDRSRSVDRVEIHSLPVRAVEDAITFVATV